MKHLLLIRHCESAHVQERYIGRTDSPLTPAGVLHARTMAQRLKTLANCQIFSSPSRRALQTARLALPGRGLVVRQDADLCEIDFGRWEGMSFDEISSREPEQVERWVREGSDFCFPEGESPAAFRERVSRAARRISAAAEETVVAFTHAGVIRFLLCHFLGLDPGRHLIFEIRPGSITSLRLNHGAAVLTGLNDRRHLEES